LREIYQPHYEQKCLTACFPPAGLELKSLIVTNGSTTRIGIWPALRYVAETGPIIYSGVIMFRRKIYRSNFSILSWNDLQFAYSYWNIIRAIWFIVMLQWYYTFLRSQSTS